MNITEKAENKAAGNDITVNYLEDRIKDALYSKYNEVANQKTRILNCEHAIARYHAYIEMMFNIDIEQAVKIVEKVQDQVDKLLAVVEGIYSL